MPPLDWTRVMGADLVALEEDPDEADDMYTVLESGAIDPSSAEASDAVRMNKLFEVAKAVMKMKATQADVAEEEMKGREQELTDEISHLEREIQQYRKHAGTGGDDFMREISQLEGKTRTLEQELQEKEEAFYQEKDKCDKFVARVDELEKENRNLKSNVDRSKMDLRDLQRQIEQQRESMLVRRDDDGYRDMVSKKNQELSEYLNEIKVLQEANEELNEKVKDIQRDLEESTAEMNKMTDEYTKLKTILQQSDLIIDDMRRERDALRAQVQDLRVQVATKSDGDDQIMLAVNSRIEEWKAVLAAKDMEIENYKAAVENMRQQIAGLQIDTDKTSLAMLQQALVEKDDQIDVLKKKLEKASTDMHAVAEQVEEIKAQTLKGLPSAYQQKKIEELNVTLRREQFGSLADRDRMLKAEQAAAEKDRQMSDLMTRMIQYEKGEYGLSEAVQEIKDCRAQIRIRDKNIEDLTSQINSLEINVNDLEMENEELRERLGLDPKESLNIEDIRQKKKVKTEQAGALNRVLAKEIERLEEERVQLKRQLRKQAMHRGARAVELGITAEDLIVAEQGYEVDRSPTTRIIMTADSDTEEARIKNQRLEKEVLKSGKEVDNFKTEMKKIESENKELKDENKQLEIGMREILAQLRENANTGIQGENIVHVPALEKLMAMIESRNAVGQYDTTLQLKAQVEQLTGRNDELRSELHHARDETAKALMQLERRSNKIVEQEKEIKALKEIGEGVIKLQALPLPEGMTPSSTEIIASLNEHLVQVLQEVSLKEDILQKMEKDLETYKRKFSVIIHQQGIVYDEYLKEKDQFEQDRNTMEDEKKALDLAREQDKIRVKEFDRMLDTLSNEPDKQQKRLGELTRKITVLRVNEKSLSRRYTAMQEVETSLRKENKKLRNDVVSMETTITERLGYLQRHKEMATYKMSVLQQALDNSVPAYELERANKQYNELTAKYRDIIQRENTLVQRSVTVETLEIEVKQLRDSESELKRELVSLKETNHSLELMLEDLIAKDNSGKPNPVRAEEISSISRKLATLEMKELNERERAEHAVRKYDNLKRFVEDLEVRNAELEQKFAEVTKLNLEAQRVELQLRDELTGAVTSQTHEAAIKKVHSLEESESKLQIEVSRLKEVAEVASHQTEAIKAQQEYQDKELMSLRKQLYDMQMESDEKTIIGKLHHHIVALQVSEGTAVRKLEASTQKVSRLQAQILRLERKIDEKDQTLYHSKLEARNKAKFLKRTIQDLRRQYSGALPLMKQEKFANTMRSLHEDKAKLERELTAARNEREAADDKLEEIKLERNNLQELIVTLKDRKGAAKVTEWHSKINEIRLQDLKLNRTIDRLNEQVKYFDNIIKSHDRTISDLEEENVNLAKEHEERQLLWEQREVELERAVDQMERQQQEMAEAAARFEEATGSLPDPSQPVTNQLEQAITKIKEHIKIIVGSRVQSKHLQKRNEELEQAMKQLEEKITQKEKIINELRLRLPMSEREVITSEAKRAAVGEDDYESKRALKVAQATIMSLQQMLSRKEESLAKYQEMLKDAREEAKSQAVQHKAEIQLLQDRLHLESDEAFRKMKSSHLDVLHSQGAPVPTNQQLTRLLELEDMVAEQDNALAVAAEKYKKLRDETTRMKKEHEDEVNGLKQKLARRKEEYTSDVKRLEGEKQEQENKITEQSKEIEALTVELEAAKEANERAPSRTMKALVERLRNQLALKEKQHKSLSQALLQVRADMVTAAEENVKVHAMQVEGEANVQHIVEKETSGLQGRIEELQERLDRLKRELKKQKEKESNWQQENEKLKQDLSKKDSALIKLGSELKELEEVAEKLDEKEQEVRAERRKVAQKEAELEPLRQKVQSLQNRLKKQKPTDADELDQPDAPKAVEPRDREEKISKATEEVIRWEEGKKWQHRVETLRGKLAEKTKELEKADKTVNMLREAIGRADRDRTGLQTRLKSAVRAGATLTGPVPAAVTDDDVRDMKQRIFQLEEKNQELSRQVVLGRDRQMEALQLNNEQLKGAVDSLERELAQRMTDQRSVDQADADMYRDLHQKTQSLHKQLVEAKQENMELRFEFEQARKENPRLKARVEDLQEYVEILKAEIDASKKREKARKKNLGTGMGGQSVEDMERVIAAMRRVVERLQGENEQLKKNVGAGGPQYNDLMRENKRLKQELQKTKLLSGAGPSTSAATSKNSSKLITENDKLRKDLKKEMDESEKLRVHSKHLEKRNEEIQQELEEAQQRLAGSNLEGMDSKSWKSVVLPKIYEEKMHKLEGELEKKTNLLKDIKSYLKAAAQREQELLKKQQELEEKVTILERFPTNIKTDSDLVKELQQTRLRVASLESEKNGILHEVKQLREMSRAGELPADMEKDDVLDKVKSYDSIIAEDVELKTKLKTVELERDRLAHQVTKLRKELEAFDPAFFEEIEDLKYNYQKAVERNVLYERQLKNLSKQFGIDVNIPTDDD